VLLHELRVNTEDLICGPLSNSYMRHVERFSRGAEFDNDSISQKHQNKGCCRVHTGNFSRGLVGWGGPKRRSYRWRWSEL